MRLRWQNKQRFDQTRTAVSTAAVLEQFERQEKHSPSKAVEYLLQRYSGEIRLRTMVQAVLGVQKLLLHIRPLLPCENGIEPSAAAAPNGYALSR